MFPFLGWLLLELWFRLTENLLNDVGYEKLTKKDHVSV